MKTTSLVSIILPTYNRARLLPRAIQSVVAQTYKHWELIIWDDGSTDDTVSIIQSFGDPRFKYFYGANQGVAYARNRAIEASTGTFLAFLDSDDEWLPNKLADQVRIMSVHTDIDLLFSDFLNVNVATNKFSRIFMQYAQVIKSLDVVQLQTGLFLVKAGMLEALASENFIATDTVIIRREILEQVGGFTEELRNGEDFELWWRMGLEGVRFAYLDKMLLTRYKFSENLSGSSIPACESTLHALKLCTRRSILAGRSDLVSLLNDFYRNTWQNLTLLHAKARDTRGMWQSFIHSLHYGASLGTLRILMDALKNLCVEQ